MSSSITILKEGVGWLAVLKPPGVSVHNRKGEDMLAELARLRPEAEEVHLVHRLDQGTSGVLLAATDKKIATELHQQFASRDVKKEYLAVCRAKGEPPEAGQKGLWKAALTKKAESRRNPKGWGGARVPCQTEWEVLKVDGDLVHLWVMPLTGRKHQIRRHAAVAGWPLLGDYRYGPAPEDGEEEVPLALHAWRLEFSDPTTGERITVEAPAVTWTQAP